MSKWISIGEAAKYLGISKDTLRRWEKAGRIKAQRSPTNRRYYTQEQLNEIIGEKGKREIPPSFKKPTKKNPLKTLGFALIGFLAAIILSLLLQGLILK